PRTDSDRTALGMSPNAARDVHLICSKYRRYQAMQSSEGRELPSRSNDEATDTRTGYDLSRNEVGWPSSCALRDQSGDFWPDLRLAGKPRRGGIGRKCQRDRKLARLQFDPQHLRQPSKGKL